MTSVSYYTITRIISLEITNYRSYFNFTHLLTEVTSLSVMLSNHYFRDKIPVSALMKINFRRSLHGVNSIQDYSNPLAAGIYLFKVNNGNTGTMCEIYSKLTIKTSEWRHWRRSAVYLLTLNRFHTLFWCFHCWLWTSTQRLGRLIPF